MIEKPSPLGIGIEIDLEAPVDPKSLHVIGGHSASDPICRLQHGHLASCLLEGRGTGQTGKAAPHYHHVQIGITAHRMSLPAPLNSAFRFAPTTVRRPPRW